MDEIVSEEPATFLDECVRQLLQKMMVSKSCGRVSVTIDFRDGVPAGVEIEERRKVRFLAICIGCGFRFDRSGKNACPKCGGRRGSLN